MNGKPKDLDQILDQALDEIRAAELDPRIEQAAADRTWETIRHEVSAAEAPEADARHIRDCSDFQALIPAHLRGGLTEAKVLLLEDHVGECVPCRRALKQARSEHRVRKPVVAKTRGGTGAKWGWRIAAAAVLFLAVIGMNVQNDILTFKTGGMIEIRSIQGDVFQVTEDGTAPVNAGDMISFQDINGLRTGKDSGVMLALADRSMVEMNERSEITVQERKALWNRGRGDAVIDLTRGTIIVEASDQGSGHLFVNTGDCDVAVTGTVFAVNHGMKGSRVSVIEGEVHVAFGGDEEILHPGGQTTTSAALAKVPVRDEIAWSQNIERHLALLAEFTKLGEEIDAALEAPELRYDTTLLDLAPADTAVYVGIPNVSKSLHQAFEIMKQKVESNDLLSEWWDESVGGSEVENEIERAMEMIRGYGEHLGQEIVVTVQKQGSEVREPLILARLTRPAAFPGFVRAELDKLAVDFKSAPKVTILQGDLPVAADATADPDAELFLWVRGDLLVVSPELAPLQDVAAMWQAGSTGFAASGFHGRLADLYADGVEWVVGVDVASLSAEAHQGEDGQFMEEMGLLDLQHVIGERKQKGELTENRVVLTFDEPRKGLASWLAEPAPMGALDFISADAYLAAGFVMREPSSVIDELFEMIGHEDGDFERELAEFEAEHGIDIREDIAAAIGGEFAFALDGPVLPKPSWKLAVEVYDPERLQSTLEWAVERLNQAAAEHTDFQGLSLGQEQAGNRTYHVLTSEDTGLSAHYTFVDGYFVAGASRALLERALRTRASGLSLPNTPGFTSLLPRDGEINFSAVVYQNLHSILGPMSRLGSAAAGSLGPEQQRLLSELGSMSRPTLTLAYGEESRIIFVHSGQGGLFGSSLGAFLRLDTLLSVQELLQQANHEGSHTYHGSGSDEEAEVDVRLETEITQG